MRNVRFSDSHSGVRNALWAVDVYANDQRALEKSIEAFRLMSGGEEVLLHPIYIFSNSSELPPIEPDFEASVREIEKKLREACAPFCSSVSLAKPLAVFSEIPSESNEVKTLIEEARHLNAEFILVCSEGRSGLGRLLMGSFAETLILHSDIPVVITHPDTNVHPNIKNILIPTDGKTIDDEFFGRVTDLATQFDSNLILMHVKPNAETQCSDAVQQFSKLASLKSIQCELKEVLQNGSIADTIVEMTHQIENPLICLNSSCSPMTATLLGSVARKIARNSNVPVWAIHTERNIFSKLELREITEQEATGWV